MIEELKALLDVLAQTPQYALWGVAMFIAWKLIIYLSTTGAIVYCVKHIVDAIRSMHSKKFDAPEEAIHTYKLDGYTIGDGTQLLAAIAEWSDGSYIHTSEQQVMAKALRDARDAYMRSKS